MHFQMQQLQQRINQLQRELSSISNQLSSLSSQSFSGNIGGSYGMSQGMGGFGQGMGNIVSYTPSHSPKAGVGDSGSPMGSQGQSFGGYGSYGGYGFSGGLSGVSGQLSNIASYTPAQSLKAGVGDGQQQNLGVSDYNYPLTSYMSGQQGGQLYGGMGGGMSGLGLSGQQSNIVSQTRPSATAGFSEVQSSPTGRQDYGVGGSNQAFRLGQY